MKKKLWLFLGIFLILIPSVFAIQPTIQTARFITNPYYIDSLDTAKKGGISVDISVPDGITSVKSAIVNFRVLASTSTTYMLLIDGHPCLNRDFKITTSPVSLTSDINSIISFDCTNVIEREGRYGIFLDSDAKSIEGSLTGWVDFIYVNNPDNSAEKQSINISNQIFQMVNKGSIEVHGTEYVGGNNGKLWVQLVNSTGQYINNAICQASIYYPDNTPFLSLATMTLLGNGIYYYDFIVPDYIGVYPVSVICYYTVATQTETADAGTIWIGDQVTGSYTTTATKNNAYWKINELLTLGKYRLDFIENFTGITQPSLMTDVSVIWWGKWNGGTVGDLTISVYNYTSGTWFALQNTISDTGGSNIEISNTISTTNLTASGLLNNGQMVLRITDTTNVDLVQSQIQTDQLVIGLNSLSGDHIENVKGSSELHISSPSNKPIKMETSCGEIDTSACSYFTNDAEFDQLEGEIEDNITIFGLTHQGDVETYWDYTTPFSVDCTALYWIKFYNGTNWIDITDTLLFSSDPSKENCIITVPITLNPNDVYQERYYYHIKTDNYMKWEVLYANDAIKIINATLYPICMQLGQQYNYTYIVPITETTNFTVNDQVKGCIRILDDIWWWDDYYNTSLSMTTSGDYASFLIEARFYRTAFIDDLIEGGFYIGQANTQYLTNILDITPTSNLKYIGGTEYIPNQNGSLEAQFLTTSGGNPVPVNNGNCTTSVYYPNGTLFLNNASMTYLSGSNGIYTKNFTVPLTEGVYISSFYCNRTTSPPPNTIIGYASGSFHVSPAISLNDTSILNYLMMINGTTFQINQSLYNDYLSLFTAINSVNATGNESLSFLIALNESVFQINNTINSQFAEVIALLNQINYSLNTTLEYKLDLINNTVIQINQSQTAYYLSLLEAISSVNTTLNGSITQYLVAINGTTYNLSVNEFYHYISVLEAINSVNGSINNTVIPLLIELNATTNTTLEFVASINQSLLNYYISLYNQLVAIDGNISNLNASEYQHFLDMSVLLNDINIGINTTLENKLYIINSTTWDTYQFLQNLTIGNVSVFANINWTQGYIESSFLSFSDKVGGEGITLQSETLTCLTNTTLQHWINATNCIQGICKNANSTMTEICAHGCANNQCIPTPQFASLSAIGIALVLLGGIYVAYKAWK